MEHQSNLTQPASAQVRHLLPKEIQQQIATHPCYSKQAHQYARMHLPVAPACNIQCHYCNRKYDCSNESRPGVVSRLLDSEAALRQFRSIKKRAPNLTVVGIAGPGDALANPQATFATLKKIRAEDPQAQLCISTNGLMLADYAAELAAVGVHHLTITINCIDPAIGAQIYPWVYYQHQRLRGREAAARLIHNQLLGLEAAVAVGMLVKVNTVLIPGVNEQHIEQVAQAVRQRGALMHNIMPLISAAEHGTFFGLNGQPSPTAEELAAARAISSQYLPQMTHCQQCRADAVGTLAGCGQDEATPPPSGYKLAVASNGETLIQTHFGHAKRFEIYRFDPQQRQFIFLETRQVAQYCAGQQSCPDDESDKQLIIEAVADCQTVLCARMGITPWRALEQLGVTPNVDFAFQPIVAALHSIAAKLASQTSTENADEVCHY